jgi:uncharacterized membrane protein YccC
MAMLTRPRPDPSSGGAEPPALMAAVRAAGRFDRHLVSFQAGLLAAIPVVAVLGVAVAAGDPVAGATMGAGAMLVGIAWRTSGGRPPLALMATDALVMALSTFVGSITGSVHWVHLIVLGVWALMGGLLIALGRRGAAVGTQAVIAVVVFGRFSQPLGSALGLAGFVLAGGLAQVIFLGIIRWPLPLRGQRRAVAAAYRALAQIAASAGASTLPAATALDEAQDALASPSLFGDAALQTLRSLVDEGPRIRLQLSAIHGLIDQLRRTGAEPDDPAVRGIERVLELAAECLRLAADAIEEDADAGELVQQRAAELSSLTATLAPTELTPEEPSAPPLAASAALNLTRRLPALAGQLRAVAALAPAAGQAGGLRSRRPHQAINHPLQELRADLEQIRANASLDSPAGRHAVRLAVVVVIAELISVHLPLHRGYWMVVAAATVLRPEFGATFTRGTERALGAALGVALAGAIAVAFNPSGGTTVAIIGVMAWIGYSVFPASFAVGFGFITALVVFLLNIVTPDTLSIAGARLLDTLIGGALGLIAYALWPTWSQGSARQSLADLVEAEREYLRDVLSALAEGRRVSDNEMRPLSRRVRLVRTNAESTVARSLSEPQTRRIDAEQSQGALAATRRLVQAVHVLRLDAQDEHERQALPGLKGLGADLDRELGVVEGRLRGDGGGGDAAHPELPDLRASYGAFERAGADDRERDGTDDREHTALLSQLDEIVDAANSLAALTGPDPADRAPDRAEDTEPVSQPKLRALWRRWPARPWRPRA